MSKDLSSININYLSLNNLKKLVEKILRNKPNSKKYLEILQSQIRYNLSFYSNLLNLLAITLAMISLLFGFFSTNTTYDDLIDKKTSVLNSLESPKYKEQNLIFNNDCKQLLDNTFSWKFNKEKLDFLKIKCNEVIDLNEKKIKLENEKQKLDFEILLNKNIQKEYISTSDSIVKYIKAKYNINFIMIFGLYLIIFITLYIGLKVFFLRRNLSYIDSVILHNIIIKER